MTRLAFLLPLLLASGCQSAAVIDELNIVDLTYAFNDESVYWPTATKFQLERVAHGYNDRGAWYASNDFRASEHGGTHLDAPIHFAEGRQASEEIPVERFFGPARVIDVEPQCRENADYLVGAEDVLRHEKEHGRIEPGTIVLVRTGFGSRYPELKSYLGSDLRGELGDLHFPGLGTDAAKLLVTRRVDMVGLDTASLDHGQSAHFGAHRVLAEANIPGLENVANLEKLPARGAFLIALPMKIEGGTGGPCRIVAVLPRESPAAPGAR